MDEDGGGELDIDEFRTLLQRIGLDVDETRLQETMDLYVHSTRTHTRTHMHSVVPRDNPPQSLYLRVV